MQDRRGRREGRGGSRCSRGNWKLRKGGSRTAIPALFTITEEEEGQRRRNACKKKKRESYSLYKSDDGRLSSATCPSSSGSGQTYTPSVTPVPTPSTNLTITSNSTSNYAATKTDSLLFNKIDERQRLARERREEREKQNAFKEAQWQAREDRAKQYYEKHLEERKRRLEEQRIKEEKRRVAVEEKRRQKQEEDRARHEAVIRRTLERSQKTKQKPNRWSWGGALHTNTPSIASGCVESAFLYPLDLAGLEHMQSAFSLYRRHGTTSQYVDRRSVSTMNLSKHTDPIITKRLSSSSATLLHSPDRGLRMRTASSPAISKAHSKPRLHQGKTPQQKNTGLRRLPLTPWESNMVNRLQQPTHAYLARSCSAVSLSGDQTVSCHPMGSVSFKTLQAQPLPHCRSHDRSLSREMVSSSSTTPRRRTTGTTQQKRPKDRDSVRKSWSNLSLPLAPILTLPPSKRTTSPGKKTSKTTAPSPGRPPQKSAGRPPTPKLLKSPAAEDPGNLRPVKIPPESSNHPTPTRSQEQEDDQVLSPSQPRPQPLGQNRTLTEPTPTESVGSPPTTKTSAGTTDPEEASRILAENRRLAREQRERDEEKRRQQEEQARLAKEEMARRKAEERAKREEEARRQAEEKGRKEEEEKQAEEEEKLQKEREEAERLQKQKEEEETRQREEAERLRQEREKHFQKEEAERLERKKRLEEIMKRTRRSDPTEKKVRNGDDTVTPTSPAASTVSPRHNNSNTDTTSTAPGKPAQSENGEFEEEIVLPSHSRLSPPEGEEKQQQQQQQQQEERVPVIAFTENGLQKPLSGVEDVSIQQGPARTSLQT
ncbi:ensconsin isoform X3 [Cololabis saira]|uniref:ensconsin isoform X3 n=1 Tax=Cololabis saira TaxID=129043 RepID=UPI002AD30681|nr:ensconsin isoform X3 [Cololabis saira]